MKLASYTITTSLGPANRVGLVRGTRVWDVNLVYQTMLRRRGSTRRSADIADALVPSDMRLLLETGELASNLLRDIEEYVSQLEVSDEFNEGEERRTLHRELSSVRLRSPVLEPRTIREFSVFEEHISRKGKRQLPDVWYEIPLYWKGNPGAVYGPDDLLIWPRATKRLDFELEIAAVIGSAGRNIPGDVAMNHLAGFTIFNDVTARDLQTRELDFMLGPAKGKDFCNVMGPLLVTPDEIDPHNLAVSVRVNGEEWAASSTRGMYHGWPEVISYASTDEWLLPGDILTSGAVAGCSGLEYTDWAEDVPLLRPGDVVELDVSGIGVLRNQVAQPP